MQKNSKMFRAWAVALSAVSLGAAASLYAAPAVSHQTARVAVVADTIPPTDTTTKPDTTTPPDTAKKPVPPTPPSI